MKATLALLQQNKEEEKSAAAAAGESPSKEEGSSEQKEGEDAGKKSEQQAPEISLTEMTLETLETLMMEGDMLEVSLDENQHIWRVLQATEPRRSKQYPDLMELEAELESVREEKLKARRKRKLESGEDVAGTSGGTKKRPREKKAVQTSEQRRKKMAAPSSGEEEEEEVTEQEDCSANPSCLRPTGKEVILFLLYFC